MKRARAKEKKEQVESKAMTKAMNESKYSAVVLVRSENELAVQRIALSTNARYSEYLRNQIRAWNHSQSIPKKSLVEIGKGCNEEEVQRLEKGVRATLVYR